MRVRIPSLNINTQKFTKRVNLQSHCGSLSDVISTTKAKKKEILQYEEHVRERTSTENMKLI